MNRPDTVHIQLQRLMQQGLTPGEACSALRNLGFTERELGSFTTTGVFRETEVRLVPGGRVTQHIGRAAGPPRRSTASVEAHSNSLLDPDPLFRGLDKPPSRYRDKVISRARFAWSWTLLVFLVVLIGAGAATIGTFLHSIPAGFALGFLGGGALSARERR